MDDLRQLLRYEIPGLITIIYFLMLSYPLLLEYGRSYNIDFKQFGKILPGLVIMVPIVALPIGFLLYQLYTTIEHENYLRNRRGIEVVTKILEKYSSPEREYPSLERAQNWWEKNEDTVKRNEVLDTVFYMKKREWTKVLERFESFYHSRRVIGMYSPIIASLATMLTAILLDFISRKFFLLIGVFLAFIVISKSKRLWKKIDKFNSVSYCVIYSLIIGTHMCCADYKIALSEFRLGIFIFLILVISLIMIVPTRKEGLLREGMDNLEENIILSEINEIIKVINRKNDLIDDEKKDG